MKLKKKSTLIGAISVLAGVSVVSVGFASWVVSAGDTAVIEGSINVETVDDQRHTITRTDSIADNSAATAVQYGAPTEAASGVTVAGQVLSYKGDDKTKVEHLNIGAFGITVANWTSANLTISVEANGDAWYKQNGEYTSSQPASGEYTTFDNGYLAALDAKLVGALPSYNRNLTYSSGYTDGPATNEGVTINSSAANSTTATSQDVSFTLNFKWGDHFKGSFLSSSDNGGAIVNPYQFYNFSTGTTPLDYTGQVSPKTKNDAAADAVESLTLLKTLLASVTYTVTITTSHIA